MDYYTPTTQPIRKKKRKHGCLISFLIFILFFIFVFVIASSDSDPSGNPSSVDDEQVSEISTSEAAEEAEQFAEPEPVFSPVFTTLANWEISVNDYELLDSVDINLLYEYQANEGSQYCTIDVTVKNIGTEADTFLPVLAYGDCTVAYLEWNGYTFSRSNMFLADDDLSMEDLNPLVSANGKVVFEIPTEVAASELPLIFVIGAGEETFSCELIKQ